MVIAREIKYLESDGISSDDRICLARQIKAGIGDKSTKVIGVDYGGKKQFRMLEKYLKENGFTRFKYSGTFLLHYDLDIGKEYRVVLTDYSKVLETPADVLLLFDDWSTSSRSWLGALYYSLLNVHKFKVQKIFVGVERDTTGGPHFAAVRTRPYRDILSFIKNRAPIVYTNLIKRNLLNYIGQIDPEIANYGYVNIRNSNLDVYAEDLNMILLR